MNRKALCVLLAGLAATLGTRTGRAQQIAAGDVSAATARAMDELLGRATTVNVTRVMLSKAIDAAAASAKVPVQYQAQIVDTYAMPVTVHLTNVPLRVVLDRMLAGTTLHVVSDGPTRLAIVEAVTAEHGQGGVTGVVMDAATKQPLAGAFVRVDSGRPVKTRENGTFILIGVSAGTHKIVVRLLGYRGYTASVTVHEGAVENITVALTRLATALTEVVTTATGDRQRLEVGNAVGTIKADSVVATTLIRNVSDLLQARVPGVVVSNTDGAVGAPSRIRLRGVNSIALNNDPIIILDGVRLNTQSTVASVQTNVGSQQMLRRQARTVSTAPALAPSRLDDIDPNTIESINVLRGPSASSLYGTDAANGVIVIKTKKGVAGAWRTNISGDLGNSTIPGTMPEMWWGWGRVNGVLTTGTCLLAAGMSQTVLGGGCTQDSVTQFNPQNNAEMRTLGTGTAKSLSATLSGGGGSLQQFFSARVTDNVGMAKISNVEQRIIAQLSFQPLRWVTLRTSLGEQYSHTSFYSLQAGNSNPNDCPLSFGTTLLTPAPVCAYSSQQAYAVTESRDESATAGWYAEETVTMFGMFTTFGFRKDVSSGFGSQVTKSPPSYPKLNFSYPLSEQSLPAARKGDGVGNRNRRIVPRQ